MTPAFIASTTTIKSIIRYETGLLGALVGDAATMPLHWIYDGKTLKEKMVYADTPEFNKILACPFYNSADFPGHYGIVGQGSPYGEQFIPLLESMTTNNGDVDLVARDFYDWLSKSYTGRQDVAGKEFQVNYANGRRIPECGAAKDNEAQCLSKAVISVGTGYYTATDDDDQQQQQQHHLRSFITFHQNNDIAIGCGQVYADFLVRIKINGRTPRQSFDDVFVQKKDSLPTFLQPHIDFLLHQGQQQQKGHNYIDSPDTTAMLEAWSKKFSVHPMMAISCACPAALLRSIHVSIHAKSYEHGIRTNLLIGGDNCSTAIAIGSALGYYYGVPESWTEQVSPDIVAASCCSASTRTACK